VKRLQHGPNGLRVAVAAIVLSSLALVQGAAAALDGIQPPIPTLTGKTGDNGWWRGDVTVEWHVDLSSGFLTSTGCGPDVVVGDVEDATRTCTATYRDSSGQLYALATRTAPINIDTTPPVVVRAVPRRPPDRFRWYSRRIRVAFSGKDALSGIASCTHPAYRGPTSASATLTGRCRDVAGNIATGTYTLKYANPFLLPRKRIRVSRPPTLDWPNIERARLYNVQLWHDGKVLSRWPTRSKLRLRHAWHFEGRRIVLKPGRYDWYVWPRIKGSYRSLVGHGVFYKRAG
jgi:hypothetical protein